MLSILTTLLGSTIGRYVIVAATGAMTIGLVLLRAMQWGAAREKSKVTEARLKELKNAAASNEEVSTLSRADRMRYADRWLRNDSD